MQKYQGDVSIIKIEKEDMAVEYKKLPEEGFIVARGKITGYNHKIVADRESLVEIGGNEKDGYFLKVNQGTATIQHQEHPVITIQEGLYYIGQQWEYDAIQEGKVID